MANIEEKRAHLESALSEISEEEMNQIVGGMDEKTKKYLTLAGEIAGLLVVGGVIGYSGYHMGKQKGYDTGLDDGKRLAQADEYNRGFLNGYKEAQNANIHSINDESGLFKSK